METEKDQDHTEHTTTIVNVSETAGSETDEKLTFRHILLIVEMICISLSASFTEMCVVPALPIMTEEWGSPSTTAYIPWVLSSFNIVGTVATSILGYLASTYGPKHPTIASFTLYAVGQIGCALSNNIYLMILFRAVQGFGMAVYSLFDSVTNVAFPAKYVPIVVGIISTDSPIGTVLGLLGGSAMLDAFSRWQNMFFVTLPLSVVFGIAFYFSSKDSDSKKGSVMNDGSKKPPFDWLGPILLTLGLVMFLSSFTLYDTHKFDWVVISFFFTGFVLLVIFCFYEQVVGYPLIPINKFKGDILIIMVASAILGVSMVGLTQIFPYMLLSPESTVITNKKMIYVGAVMLPLGAVEIFISPVAGVIGEKIGFSLCIVIGTALEAVSLTLLTFFHYTLTQVLICLAVYGSSFSLIFVSCVNVLLKKALPHEFSILCGTCLLTNLMGNSIGPIITDLISRTSMYHESNSNSESSSASPEEIFGSDKGYTYAILFTALTAIAAFILALFLTGKFDRCKKYEEKEEHSENQEANEKKKKKSWRKSGICCI